MWVVSRVNGQALPKWQESLFAAMERNADQVTDFFRLPVDQVVDRFAAHIIGHVIQKNVTALLLCLAQDGRNIGPLP